MMTSFMSDLATGNLDITFAFPWAWWLLPLPLLVYFFISSYKSHSESVTVSTLASLTTDNSHGINKTSKTTSWPLLVMALIWFCLVMATARPEQIIVSDQKEVSVRDILLVLDISGSMAIRDMENDDGALSRMDVMKTAVNEFIEKREHDNIGLIVFGSQALPLSPVSSDHNALTAQIEEMVPGMAGPQTSIGDAIGVAIRTYRQFDEHQEKDEAKERMMILLTDGLDTSSYLPPRVALRLAQKQNIIIHTIAFGNSLDDDNDTSIDLALMRDIAKATKGSFHQASHSQASLSQVYSQIDKLAPRKVTLVGQTQHKPLLFIPLFLALVLAVVLLMFIYSKGKKDD